MCSKNVKTVKETLEETIRYIFSRRIDISAMKIYIPIFINKTILSVSLTRGLT